MSKKEILYKKPKVVIVIPRGEAVRNFLYTDFIKVLGDSCQVTLLTVIDDPKFNKVYKKYVHDIIILKEQPERKFVKYLRFLVHEAHFRWIWSKVAQNVWEVRREWAKSRGFFPFFRDIIRAIVVLPFANRFSLKILTKLDNYLSVKFRKSDYYLDLFKELNPDLVFNGSHIHGQAGELPIKLAHSLGYKTVGFIFSWDNLTSRSRIFVPYDYTFVWHDSMKKQLLYQYDFLDDANVFAMGTPQFDFHFSDSFLLTKDEFCKKIGLDSKRPIIFYSTGMEKHFPEEYLIVESIIKYLNSTNWEKQPQLVVRTYIKGTSTEMKKIAIANHQNVFFPEILWEEKWFTPMIEDSYIYSNLLRYCDIGINPASTVSLELMIYEKPIINIGFDPPGSNLTEAYKWKRHIFFDHYNKLVQANAVKVAWNEVELHKLIYKYLTDNKSFNHEASKEFIESEFGILLDGNSGKRIGEKVIEVIS